MTFRRSRFARVFAFLLAVFFAGIPCLYWLTMLQEHNLNAGALLFFFMLHACLSALIFSLSGPDDITFDLEERTYRRVWGWPFFTKTRLGTWKDFWGVYLGRTQGTSAYFCVGITWWGGERMTLKRFSGKSSAENFALSLMQQMELSRVMPPPNLRPQS